MRGPAAVTAMVCSQWAARLPSAVADGPAVRLHPGLVAAQREHRLDGQAQAGLDAPAATAGAVVGDLRLLVHLGADAVPDEGAHDAVAVRQGDVLDGARPMSLQEGARPGGGDAGEHGLSGGRRRGARAASGTSPTIQRARAVAVPAVDDGAGVDGHDLALADDGAAGHAVDDLVVDGDAQRVRDTAPAGRARR